jgi:hypothetical protein
MLNGIDPIIIIHRYKKAPPADAALSTDAIPIVSSSTETYVPLPPIPIYLSESITGIFIDSESKNIDIETETQTYTDGKTAEVNQRGIASGVSINMIAKKDSLGMILLSSLIDTIFDKVTSKEYAITYIHGATTIFLGLLHTFAIDQDATSDLLKIKIELSKGQKQPVKVVGPAPLKPLSNALTLG